METSHQQLTAALLSQRNPAQHRLPRKSQNGAIPVALSSTKALLLPSAPALPFSPVPRSQQLSPERDAPAERGQLDAPKELLSL